MTETITDLQKNKAVMSLSNKHSVFTNDELKQQQDDFKNRRVKNSDNYSEVGKKYMEYLFPKKQVGDSLTQTLKSIETDLSRPNRVVQQEMAFDKAKVIWWKIFTIELNKEGVEFVANENEVETMKNLLKYFIGDPSSKYDLNRGICLVGATGCGKTFLMDSFRIFCKQTNNSRAFKRRECMEIKDEIALTKGSRNQSPESVMKKYHHDHYFFDDLGAEPVPFNFFGEKMAFMEQILTRRDRNFRKGNCITHLTTNLIPHDYTGADGKPVVDEIIKNYGNRIRSRMAQMYNFILWNGLDKRTL